MTPGAGAPGSRRHPAQSVTPASAGAASPEATNTPDDQRGESGTRTGAGTHLALVAADGPGQAGHERSHLLTAAFGHGESLLN